METCSWKRSKCLLFITIAVCCIQAAIFLWQTNFSGEQQSTIGRPNVGKQLQILSTVKLLPKVIDSAPADGEPVNERTHANSTSLSMSQTEAADDQTIIGRNDDRNITKTIIYTDGWWLTRMIFDHPIAQRFELHSPRLCDGYRCAVRTQNSSLNITDADMVVFFGTGLPETPPVKMHDQLWTFETGESQRCMRILDPQKWNGMFNYSISYRRTTKSSKLHVYFARDVVEREEKLSKNFYQEKLPAVSKKKPNALWFVSNCKTRGLSMVQSGRMEYVQALSNHIHVDAFTRTASCRSKLGDIARSKTQGEPSYSDYWFYLAFENRLCRDYITEKFWKVLGNEGLAIPIVLGGLSVQDYKSIAPPNSYIDVRNFSSPLQLAQHLKYVVENETAFNYYHQWRNDYELASYKYKSKL